MVSGTAIRQGLRLAGKIDKKYNLNKIFIDKYAPPGYRKTLHKIVDVAGALGGGYGIYRFGQSLLESETPGMGGQIPFKRVRFTSRKSYQTRSRPTERACRRYNEYRKPSYRS